MKKILIILLISVLFSIELYAGTNTVNVFPQYVASDGTPFVFYFQYSGGANTLYGMNMYGMTGYSSFRGWEVDNDTPAWNTFNGYAPDPDILKTDASGDWLGWLYVKMDDDVDDSDQQPVSIRCASGETTANVTINFMKMSGSGGTYPGGFLRGSITSGGGYTKDNKIVCAYDALTDGNLISTCLSENNGIDENADTHSPDYSSDISTYDYLLAVPTSIQIRRIEIKTHDNVLITSVTGNWSPSSIGDIVTAGNITLPVTLSTFTAQYLNSKPTLYWQTQSEEDNMGWFIYRNSIEDFTSAEKITGMIEGHGTTTEPQSYIYEDAEQLQADQTYYYWLESVDYSGTIHHYDKVAQVTIPHPNDPGQNVTPPVAYDISADPNPFSYTTNISFVMDQPSLVDVAIYNVKGQLVKSFNSVITSQENETVAFSWNGKNDAGKSLSNGVYLYLVKVNGKDYATKQLILMK